MKTNRRTQWLLALLALICVCGAFWQLKTRVAAESGDKLVAVVIAQEDIAALADAGGTPESAWYQALSDAGLSAVVLPAEACQDDAVTRPILDAGLQIAQLGGENAAGLWFAEAKYDLASVDTPHSATQLPPAEPGRVWVLVENNTQTGCVLPDGVSAAEADAPFAKGFYLRQNQRTRAMLMEPDAAQKVGDALFRAVADRGIQVLWIAPLETDDGIVSEPEVYVDLLTGLETRIQRAGYAYGIPTGLTPFAVPPLVLILCGIGVFAAAVLLLTLLFPLPRLASVLLLALGVLESVGGALLKPELQAMLLALSASILFPAAAIWLLGRRLKQTLENGSVRLKDYLVTLLEGVLIVLLGGCCIGAVLGSWRYVLVLQVFRGVKLSQGAVYLFSIVLIAGMLLELKTLRRDGLRQILPAIDKKLLVRLIGVFVILVGAGTIYLLRGGDGMLGISALEAAARSRLENLLLFRPRTKEFFIAWPAIALAFCFAARRNRLFTWCFGALGGIGFASVANTFCHIRAHFLVSLARTALGLLIGMLLGMLLYRIFRPGRSENTKE